MTKADPAHAIGTILAVDDERTSLKLLTTVLAAEGYEVHSAVSGEQALESVAQTQPELILLDIVMPGIDGFEVCRQLKTHAKTSHIPVIFLSATSDSKERVAGFKLGAVDFVPKPFQRHELLARVHTHLSLARLQVALKRETAELGEANQRLQREIAKREEMAAALSESEEKFRTLAGSAQDAFVMLDDEGRVIFWNRAAIGMFGYSEQEIYGKKFHDHVVPERFQAAHQNRFEHFKATGTGPLVGKSVELHALRRDGSEFQVELSLATVKLRQKWVAIAVIRDITGRLRTQETLQRSEERLNLVLDAAHMGIWDRDLITGKLSRSIVHDQIFGYDTIQERWTDETLLNHLVPEDRERRLHEIATCSEQTEINSEYRIIRAGDHAQRWIQFQGKVYHDEKGKPIRRAGIIRDITDQKLAEQERQATEVQSSLSQKLESVGRLASGVAHEINTPMQFITDNTQFLKRAVTSLTEVLVAYRAVNEIVASGKKPDEALALARAAEETNEMEYLLGEIPKTFDETMSGLQRVTHIIKSLKEFSHPNTTAKHPADLNKAINTTIAVSRHEWKYVAEVVTELDPDLPMIPLCIDEMNQVMLNLIVNAAHAIGDAIKQRGEAKGVITIRTKQDGACVLIEVEDNGTGIPESAQSHIFEPFFTTKGVGKGTGQGLAIIRTIILKNHDGAISFTTTPGKGTTFHIRLPMPSPDEAETPGTVASS
jgi:two-component system, NtrC family, sensor kinase